MTRPSLTFLSVTLTVALLLGAPGAMAATAPLPTGPRNSGMVDGPTATGAKAMTVRTIVRAGSHVWVGGVFSQVDDPSGVKVADAANLAVFDATTGLPVSGAHLPLVTATRGTAEVFDSSVGSNGTLYIAGHFDAVDGQAREGVAAIDAATGALLPFAPKVGTAHAVLAKANAIYVGGGTKVYSFRPSGKRTPGFVPPKVTTDGTLRTEMTSAQFRDIAKVGHTLVAACQCDQLIDAAGTHDVKAVVELDSVTGALLNWAPAGLTPETPASGLGVIVHNFPGTAEPTVFLAAGGSDFTAAYDFTSGVQRWLEDTSGSSQALTWYGGYLIVGGHFDWTQAPGGSTCGDNKHPNRTCLFTPRLVAMDASTGAIKRDPGGSLWNPGICCLYNGVWALLPVNGSTLYLGGQFTEAGGNWTCKRAWGPCLTGAKTQTYFARFAPPAA